MNNANRWKAVRVHLGRLRAAFLALRRAVTTQAYAYRWEEVQLPGLPPPVHALRPPDQTRPTPCSPAETACLASGRRRSQIGSSPAASINYPVARSAVPRTAPHSFLCLIPIPLIHLLNIAIQPFKYSKWMRSLMVIARACVKSLNFHSCTCQVNISIQYFKCQNFKLFRWWQQFGVVSIYFQNCFLEEFEFKSVFPVSIFFFSLKSSPVDIFVIYFYIQVNIATRNFQTMRTFDGDSSEKLLHFPTAYMLILQII